MFISNGFGKLKGSAVVDACPRKVKIIAFVGFYFPGFKAGGPLRTLLHMVEHLSECCEFWIVTRDRDLGDVAPYRGLEVNTWVEVGASKVMYCSPDLQTVGGFASVINSGSFDVLYLNSFFDPVFTMKPLFARYFRKIGNLPIILAPRGEFSKGALQLKSIKKRIYIFVARLVGLYSGVKWQASSVHEVEDIMSQRIARSRMDIAIALDLPESFQEIGTQVSAPAVMRTSENALRIVFLSRVSPKKNLDFALRILGRVAAKVVFDIYGPLGDSDYWGKCQELMRSLPPNIRVSYCGEVGHHDVGATFARYDLFLFPTRGENYGHVVAESLMVGTPVLLSDQTPWRNLAKDGLGWDFQLDDMDSFVMAIDSFVVENGGQVVFDREDVRRRAKERIYDPEVFQANRDLFLAVVP